MNTNNNSEISPTVRSWRFWLPLAFQTALIVAIPAQAILVHLTGKTAILQTVPVDPYDLLRGYSQTLTYDISRSQTLEKLPGWNKLNKEKRENLNLYVILEAPPEQTSSGRPQPWKPIAVSASPPTNLPANQVALKGRLRYGTINYGLENYYFPEDRREQFNKDISQAQTGIERSQRKPLPFVVEVKVDAQGNSVPVSLWVRDRNYRF
ncbi:GDYXXLXY domain-containing protein [Phormidium sp. LEGE 05292]|uniref:GDYXXLXY domain-containing protein n=1 Tax=[Phormidium] sp. LEGE 05292 TaxID=767427 RepID=UPI001880EB29|nr:GDYXXLXY domain-containing protein [Phormidium sp. LEGE 05292]MBE9226814.1 GDYXXLXY domain-containing protein [Phormidium sp. LEGE 05292]